MTVPMEVQSIINELERQDFDLSTLFNHGKTDVDTILYHEICGALRKAEGEIKTATARFIARTYKSQQHLGPLDEFI